MIYLGIDPGLTGAIGVLDHQGRFLDVHDMPTAQKGKGNSKVKNEVDCRELMQTLRGISDLGSVELFAVLEEQRGMPSQASGTVFSLGDTYGTLRCALAAEAVPYELVTPNVWKKRRGLKAGDKDSARAQAIRLFPNAPLGRKKDHNRAEALLLAHYAREIHLAQQRGEAA